MKRKLKLFTGTMPSQVSGHRQNARVLRVRDILSAEKEGPHDRKRILTANESFLQ